MTTRALALLLLLLPALPAVAADVLVVRSQDLPAFSAVEQGFLSTLGRPATRVTLTSGGAPALQAALARRPPLVLALGQEAARAVMQAQPDVPVVCALVPSPETLEGRIVAVPMFAAPARQVQLLRSALPGARRVGLVYDPARTRGLAQQYAAAAQASGLTLVRQEVAGLKDFAPAVRGMVGRVDVLWLVPDPSLVTAETFRFLVQTSFERKLPLVAYSQAMAKAGALAALEVDPVEMGRRAGGVGRRLLGGEAGAQPEAPEGTLYLNARSAGLLGVPLSAGVKAQAAKVFE